MVTIEQILNLAEEYGIGIETNSSHSGIFYEEQDGSIREIEIPCHSIQKSSQNTTKLLQ